MNTELLLRVQRSDPAPPHEAMPHEVWDSQQVLDELQRRIDGDAVSLTSDGRSTPRGWVVASIVAAATVIALGSLALLARPDGATPPADTPTPTTITEAPPTTDAAVTSDTVAATTTTLAAAPVVPPGEGPKIEFVQVESPVEGALGNGTWFNGALYALSDVEGELLRSVDGVVWESVPGPPSATNARHRMLQSDGDRLVLLVMPRDGDSILVNISSNGRDWISSTIETPAPDGSNMAGEFDWDEGFFNSDNFAVGPEGIVVTATLSLSFEGDGFANSLVGADEGIHVEMVDLDLDRGVMIVKFLDETNDEQIGDLQEFDLNTIGFSGAFANLIDAMNADPNWKPHIDGFLAQLTGEMSTGSAFASVGYAWFSPDGTTWETVSRGGPLDGGEFSSVLATSDGFVATAYTPYRAGELPRYMRYLADGFDSTIVWESDDGTTWTKAAGLTSRHGTQPSKLVEWKGAIVEHVGVGMVRSATDDTEVWTLASPQTSVFPDVPTDGMLLSIADFGLFGSPSYGWRGPDATELLFSTDGTAWNRWEPPEFEIGGPRQAGGERLGSAWVVGVGDDFVVMQRRGPNATSIDDSLSLWVGQVQHQ
jgi:hypothetical protein